MAEPKPGAAWGVDAFAHGERPRERDATGCIVGVAGVDPRDFEDAVRLAMGGHRANAWAERAGTLVLFGGAGPAGATAFPSPLDTAAVLALGRTWLTQAAQGLAKPLGAATLGWIVGANPGAADAEVCTFALHWFPRRP